MTREQAINYLISSGFSEEQVSEVVRALTYELTTKKCTTCAYREIDGKPHEMCKSCVCGDRYREDSTTKNDLTVDCISREQAKVAIRDKFKDIPSRVEINTILNELPSVTPQPCEDAVSRQEVLDLIADYDLSMGQVVRGIHALPSVTPQEPQTFKWCTNCKEYDQEKHCCHRWSKVIRNTVEEMKQEYIERDVLDKIRAEIENDWQLKKYPSSPFSCGLRRAIEILDKYKAEQKKT